MTTDTPSAPVARPAGEDARLIADIAAAPPPIAIADTAETRLERIAHEPTAVFEFMNGRWRLTPAPEKLNTRDAHIRAGIASAMLSPAPPGAAPEVVDDAAARQPRGVPARQAPQPRRDDAAQPFSPTAEDIAAALDGRGPLTAIIPVLALSCAAAIAIALWLVLSRD